MSYFLATLFHTYRLTWKYHALGALNALMIKTYLDVTMNDAIGIFFFTTLVLLYLKYMELEVFKK